MTPTGSVSADYMVLRDLGATYARRVRIMVLAASALMILLGFGWAVFFALRGDWTIVAADCLLVLSGVVAIRLTARNRQRAAMVLLSVVLFVLVVGMACFLDVPSVQVPRSIHQFLIPLAVATYLMLKDERAWVRHGLPLVCLAAAVFFGSSNFGFATAYALPESTRGPGTWVNNFSAMAALYLLVYIFVGDINRMESYLHGANNRFVGLVGGMFPRAIAERLLGTGETFAERHANCSILFADIVGFTSITERMRPELLVKMLSEIFVRFDHCVEQRGLTKIKTIGDAYMVAAGVPEANPEHARVLVELAQQMLAEARGFEGIDLRIGIASGELVAGVIGKSRQIYDVWGDVVNMASRMESHGLPGRIQVSESSFVLVRPYFEFEQRASVAIKGKDGSHNVYMLRAA
jgi:adenylate cyclase